MVGGPSIGTARGSSESDARSRWWRELLLIGGGYGLYHLAQLHAPVKAAVTHGLAVLDGERWAHVDVEHWLNRVVSASAWVAVPADYYYEVLHFGVTISVLLWLWCRHPARYRLTRRVLLGGSLLALAVFWLFPVAPPRLLPLSGFIDTSVAYHTLFSLETGQAAKAADLFASMPSLHLGWALWSAWALSGVVTRPFVRWLMWLYPALTGVVVVGTANHYLFDLLGGVLVMGAGAAATLWLPGAWRTLGRGLVTVGRRVRPVWIAGALGPLVLTGALVDQHRFVSGAVHSLAHADPVWLAGAVAAEVASMSAFSRLHRRTLKMTGVRVRQRTALAINFASNAISATVPVVGTAVGAANTWRQYHRRGVPVAAVTWAIGATGVASSLAFTLLVAAGAAASGNPAAMGAGAGATAVSAGLVAVLIVGTRVPAVQVRLERVGAGAASLASRISGRFSPTNPAELAPAFLRQLGSFRPSAGDMALAVGTAVINWAFDVACLALSIRAVGGHVGSADMIVIWAAAGTAASLSLTPAGLGIVEPILAASLAVAGMPRTTAIAATVLYRAVTFLAVAAIGWAVQFLLASVRPATVAMLPARSVQPSAKAA